MIVRRIVKDVDGNLEGTFALTQEQASFLINMGLITLIAAGTASIQDMTQEEFEEQAKASKDAQADEGNSVVTIPAVDPTKLN